MVKTEVAEIDAAIKEESGAKERLEQGLRADKAAQEEHEKKRKEISYKALTGSNVQLEKQLEEVEEALAKSIQRTASRQQIETSNERIAQLREQKTEAIRRAQLERYSTKQDALITAGAKLEKMLVGFVEEKGAVEAIIGDMDKLSFGLFDAGQVPHQTVAKNLAWALEQRLKIPAPYRDHDFRERHLKPINEIFARLLKHTEAITGETAGKSGDKKTAVGDEDTSGKMEPTRKAKKAGGE